MNDNIFTVCITLVIVALIGSITFYQYNELKSIERNIESAIVKGIDPVAVRCAYSSMNDMLCMANTASLPKK